MCFDLNSGYVFIKTKASSNWMQFYWAWYSFKHIYHAEWQAEHAYHTWLPWPIREQTDFVTLKWLAL